MPKPLVLITALLTAAAVATTPALAGWEEGVAAFKKGSYQQAITEFQTVVQQSPEGYQGHYMLGLSLQRADRREEALHHLRKAYDLNPNEVSVKISLAQVYTSLRRHEETVQLLKGVDAGAFPVKQQQVFYQMRAQAHKQLGNDDAAMNDYRKLAQLSPDSNPEAHYIYGALSLNEGRTDEAIKSLSQAVRIKPNDTDIRRTYAKALIRKGRETRDKAAKKQHYMRAAKEAAAVAKAEPTFNNLLLQASAEIGAALFDEAAKTAKAAIAKDQGNWTAHYYLGQAYSSLKQYDDAEAPLNTAITKTNDPGNLRQVWRQLGYVYEKQKKYSDSIAAYQKAGDSAGVARVQENERIALDNKKIEEENQRIKEMEEEAKKLEEELKELGGGGGGL